MQTIFGLIEIFLIFSFFVGLFQFIKKDTRKTAKRLTINSFIAFFVVAVIGTILDREHPNQPQEKQQETVTEQPDNEATTTPMPTTTEHERQVAEKPEAQINPRLNPAKNIKLISDYFKKMKIPAKPDGVKTCLADNYCSIITGKTKIEAIGGYVKVWLSNDVTSVDYLSTCAMVLSGLSGVTEGQTRSYVGQAFVAAAKGANRKFNIANVDMTVKPANDSRLECDFFHFTK